jgi:hypothetical protein
MQINGLCRSACFAFSNPVIPYSWEAEDNDQKGFFCLFTDHFVHDGNRLGNLQDSQLFKIGGTPVFFINEEQQKTVADIFIKMMNEIQSDYLHKYDMLRAYLHLLIHETMKMHPAKILNLIRMLRKELLPYSWNCWKDNFRLTVPKDF